MAWGTGKKPDDDKTTQMPATQVKTLSDQTKKENSMTDKDKTKTVTVTPQQLEGITEELKRFTRKLEDLLVVSKTTPTMKTGHAAVMAVRRASQDVSFEMKKLRGLLSSGE